MTDTAQIVAWTVAICTPIATLIGVLSTKGVDGWIKLRNSKRIGIMEDKQYEDRAASEAYTLFKDAVTARLAALEDANRSLTEKLERSREAHAKCEVMTADLRGDIRVMQKEIEALKRHEIANKEHNEQMAAKATEEAKKAAAEAAEAKAIAEGKSQP